MEQLNEKNIMYWKWKKVQWDPHGHKVRIKSKVKEEQYLGAAIHDNLLTEKHINRIIGNTFKMLKSIWMDFHFLEKDMIKL